MEGLILPAVLMGALGFTVMLADAIVGLIRWRVHRSAVRRKLRELQR